MSLEETGILNRNIDIIRKLQRELNPFSEMIKTIQDQSPTKLLDKQFRNLRALERTVFGPFEEIRQLGSHFHNEILWMREIEKRFYLPETTEVKNLLREFNRIDLAFNNLQNAIKTITTPWLDINNKLQSIDGFAKLYDLGHAIRTTPAFDPQLTDLLRATLGDWREKISWPPEIFTDPLKRTVFYEERGLDPSLTAFPANAFQQIIGIAGLKEESVPATDSVHEEMGFERTNKAHDQLQRLETELRRFIDKMMKRVFGENWIKTQLPSGMRETWEETKEKNRKNGEVKRPLIDYADFPDYVPIIVRKDNWQKVFAPVFRRKPFVEESFQRLYPIRNCTMHARLITQEDELILQVESMHLKKAIDEAIEPSVGNR